MAIKKITGACESNPYLTYTIFKSKNQSQGISGYRCLPEEDAGLLAGVDL
jgi:hypothetical protein